MTILDKEWREFEQVCNSDPKVTTKNACYAGMAIMFNLLVEVMPDDEELAMKYITAIGKELSEYTKNIVEKGH